MDLESHKNGTQLGTPEHHQVCLKDHKYYDCNLNILNSINLKMGQTIVNLLERLEQKIYLCSLLFRAKGGLCMFASTFSSCCRFSFHIIIFHAVSIFHISFENPFFVNIKKNNKNNNNKRPIAQCWLFYFKVFLDNANMKKESQFLSWLPYKVFKCFFFFLQACMNFLLRYAPTGITETYQ